MITEIFNIAKASWGIILIMIAFIAFIGLITLAVQIIKNVTIPSQHVQTQTLLSPKREVI